MQAIDSAQSRRSGQTRIAGVERRSEAEETWESLGSEPNKQSSPSEGSAKEHTCTRVA